jgi:hypothetical protein
VGVQVAETKQPINDLFAVEGLVQPSTLQDVSEHASIAGGNAPIEADDRLTGCL